MRRLYRPLLAAASSSRRHAVSMASAASTAGIIASGVAAPLAALYVGQRSVIYPRPPVYDDAKAYGGEFAEIVRADGVVGLFVPPPKEEEQIVALYFHGNADQITWGGAMIGKELRERGIGTFAAEYPGYGLAAGDPTEESIMQAAEAALRAVKELRPEAKVTLVGQSIGCAPALAVAAAPGLPVVLISPFTSLAAMASTLLPFIPQRALKLLVKDKFDNAALAPSVTSPVLVLHGTRDEIVPYDMGEAMSEALADATFVPLEKAGHNDVLSPPHDQVVFDAIEKFARGNCGGDVEHYRDVMTMLQTRWAGLTAEAKTKMAAVNEDSTQREESMAEFMATWNSHAVDGKLTRENFVLFNQRHLQNIKARLGWAPDLTNEDSEMIWEAIHALNPDDGGIGMADYGRYHAVMKLYIN
jgi:hypothetical protein